MKAILSFLLILLLAVFGASAVGTNESAVNDSFTISGINGTETVMVTVTDSEVVVEGSNDSGNETFTYGQEVKSWLTELYAALFVSSAGILFYIRSWWQNKNKKQKTDFIGDVVTSFEDGNISSDEAVLLIKKHL